MKKIVLFLLVSNGLVFSQLTVAKSLPGWALNTSIQRALEVAPEMNNADAEIGKQKGKQEQAIAWPNPSISIQVDNSLGLEDAAGGYDVTQLSVSQPLVFGRLKYQRRQAEAGISIALSQRHYQQLSLEYKVAQRFHHLQLAQARLKLAEKRLLQARRYQTSSNKQNSNDLLIRYLTPLETLRLDIVLQVAKQTMEVAEGKYNEAAASFKALLNLHNDTELSLAPLIPVPTPDNLNSLNSSLKKHPALKANKHKIESSLAGIAVAKSTRFADPTLTLFLAEEYLGNRRQNSTGIMLNIQIPLWNNNKGRVSEARYQVYQAQADLEQVKRELQTNLHKSYLHLGHLIKQAEHYRNKLLAPAQKMFTLTRKGFETGALNILTLIDANNTYFDSQGRYLELLQEAWLELAEVRQSAGLFVTNNQPMTIFKEVN